MKCSTPYGITAEVTIRTPTGAGVFFECSTPYGITAEVTPGTLDRAPPPDVLNALRHHGGGHLTSSGKGSFSPFGAQRLTASRRRSHSGLRSDARKKDRCSTPYGITAEVTSSMRSRAWLMLGAQRLTASRRRSLSLRKSGLAGGDVLNALRHHGGGHPKGPRLPLQVQGVLNALRHHGGGHHETRRATARLLSAQRLTASRRRSLRAGSEQSCGCGAQRLTASRRRSHISRRKLIEDG